MAHPRVALAASAVVVIVGCAGAEPEPAAAVLERPPATAAGSFEGTRWGTFHSKRFELSVELPDGAAWKIDDHRSGWLRATHGATRSALLLRSWSEDDNVTRKACYARARQWEGGLPDLDAQPLIEDRVGKLLGDRDARIAVGVVVRGGAEPVTGGFVVAVVGDLRRCVLLAFQTEASGSSAEDAVADRLALVSGRLLPAMKLDQSLMPSREPAILPSAGPGGAGGAR